MCIQYLQQKMEEEQKKAIQMKSKGKKRNKGKDCEAT